MDCGWQPFNLTPIGGVVVMLPLISPRRHRFNSWARRPRRVSLHYCSSALLLVFPITSAMHLKSHKLPVYLHFLLCGFVWQPQPWHRQSKHVQYQLLLLLCWIVAINNHMHRVLFYFPTLHLSSCDFRCIAALWRDTWAALVQSCQSLIFMPCYTAFKDLLCLEMF